jgi:glycolate oxidase
MNAPLLRALTASLGADGVSSAPEDLAAYAYDGTWSDQPPALVAHPRTTQQVVDILRLAQQHRIPVVPRGAGTGLSGGALPVPGAICLNLARMNRILEISRPDTLAVVQPGVVTRDLQVAVERLGLFYPPDPASIYQCTIGGNVSTNAGGPRCLKYGVTGDYVLGLEVVLPGGEVLRLGGRTMKNVAGYDLAHLFVGSEGTLGVVTEITLRLIPLPAAQLTALATFPRLTDACLAVGKILEAGVTPLVAELMDQTATRAVEEFKHLGLPTDVEALLLVAVDGDVCAVQDEIAKVAEVLRASGARDVHQATTAEESEGLWEARRNLAPALARQARNRLGEDITVPRSRIPEMVARIGEIGRKHNLVIALHGHVGDGNLHPGILCDRRDAAQMARVEKAAGELLQAAVELGGTLTGEHGIGVFKREYITAALDANALAAMVRVKAVFDPYGIMNPGKKLPALIS